MLNGNLQISGRTINTEPVAIPTFSPTMKVVISDFWLSAAVEYGDRTIQLHEAYAVLVAADGRRCSQVANESGLDHAVEYNFRKGKSNSLKAFVALADVLGYDVVLRKRGN